MNRLLTTSLIALLATLAADASFAASPNRLTPGKAANIDLGKAIRTGVVRENAERWVPMKFSGASSNPKGLPLKSSSKRISILAKAAHQGHFYTVTVGQISKKQRYVRGPNRRFKWQDVYKLGKLVTRKDSKEVRFVVDVAPIEPISLSVGGTKTIPLPAPHLKWKVRRKSYRACEVKLGAKGELLFKGLKAGSSTVAIEANHQGQKFRASTRVTVSPRSTRALQLFVGETSVIDPESLPALSRLTARVVKSVTPTSTDTLDVTWDGRRKCLLLTGKSPGDAEITVLYEAMKGKSKTERSVVLNVQVLSDEGWDATQRMQAILFPGGGFLSFPYIPFDSYKELTIEAWVYGWRGSILSQGRTGDPENSVWLRDHRSSRPTGGWERGRGTDIGHVVKTRPVKAARWRHIALTFHRGVSRMHVDGRVVSTKRSVKGAGPLTKKRALHIGCDATKRGRMTAHATGFLRTLRISNVARYSSKSFEPEPGWKPDDKTELLIDATDFTGSFPDRSPKKRNGRGSRVRAVTFRRAVDG